MLRPRKLVNGLRLDQAVAPRAEEDQIPYLTSGIAGNVDNTLWLCGDDLLQSFGMNAITGRINHDQIRWIAHGSKSV